MLETPWRYQDLEESGARAPTGEEMAVGRAGGRAEGQGRLVAWALAEDHRGKEVCLFFYLFDKHLLSNYSVLGTVPGSRATET